MKKSAVFLIIFLWSSMVALNAQMPANGTVLYGNEWIDYDQQYLKIAVLEDGVYRFDRQAIIDAGLAPNGAAVSGANFQLFHFGEEVPIRVSSTGAWGANDFLEFVGTKNRGDLDAFLYPSPEVQLNPRFSMFTDTSAYFLTWSPTTNSDVRYELTVNDVTNPPAATNSVIGYAEAVFSNNFDGGILRTGGSDSWRCVYDEGEGYAASKTASSTTQNLAVPNLIASGNAEVNIRYSSGYRGNQQMEIAIGNNVLFSDSITNFEMVSDQRSIPADWLSATTPFRFNYTANGNINRYRIASIAVNYPRDLDLSGNADLQFELAPSNNERYLEFSGFAASGTLPVLFDRTNNRVYEAVLDGGTARFLVAPTAERSEFWLTAQSRTAVAELRDFVDYRPQMVETDYLIVTHPTLRASGDYVQQYADYRASVAGGSYDVLIADIHQIYDQYSYGVHFHEMALRNFVHQIDTLGDPEYLFIIGKGASVSNFRPTTHPSHNWNLVAGFGFPNSDHLIASTNDEGSVPKVAVGRLAARTPEEVRWYLEKIRSHELLTSQPQTVEDRAWQKRVVHLGGGDEAIQNFIKGELQTLEQTIENSKFAGDVVSFFKTSTEPVQQAESEVLTQYMRDGISMITFFGHSAPRTLDFDLGQASQYNNIDRYPFIYTIGCHTSRMYENDGTIAENYVLIEDEGAVGFLGATYVTTLSNLANYAKRFYQNLSEDQYGESIGKIINGTIANLGVQGFFGEQLKNVMVLHGDPALRLHPQPGPDYLIDPASIKLNPELVSTQLDSFGLEFSVMNLGQRSTDSLQISVTTGIDTLNFVVDSFPRFRENVTLKLPVQDYVQIGSNQFRINVDTRNDINELPAAAGEANNSTDFSFVAISNSAIPVMPENYSIQNVFPEYLVASTGNPFAERQRYFFQIDTTNAYDSPLLTTAEIEETGGVLKWQPTIQQLPNTVYYWRISIDSSLTEGNGFLWNTSSFLVNGDLSKGWNQSHIDQKNENELRNVEFDLSGNLNFIDDLQHVRAINGFVNLYPWELSAHYVNNELVQFYWFTTPGINFVVFDPLSFDEWLNEDQGNLQGLYGSDYRTLNLTNQWFAFGTQTRTKRESAINFVNDIIPDGHYVLAFSLQQSPTNHYNPQDWAADSIDLGTNLFQVLEAQGATALRQMIDNPRPWSMFFQKGNPSFDRFTESYSAADELNQMDVFLPISWTRGEVKTNRVGPAAEWDALQWELENYDAATDSIRLTIIGETTDGDEVVLQTYSQYQVSYDLSTINANQYPYLRYELFVLDEAERTAPNLGFWRTQFVGLPEAALAPKTAFSLSKDTLQQGEPLILEIAVENLSGLSMDSLLTNFSIRNANTGVTTASQRYAPLPELATLPIKYTFSTEDLQGPQQLVIDVNPNNDQPEQTHFNNVGFIPFYVSGDTRNPLLDVTFDGRKILDRDIVSSEPRIIIDLRDENKYLALNDTSLMEVAILHPDGVEEVFTMTDPRIQFTPATTNTAAAGDNRARIALTPMFDTDGEYQLSVRGRDVSGNQSGATAYSIRFQVFTKSMISDVLNYPNPFSTSTQFVFTLTGNEVPDDLMIQIMTVSGRVVKTIDRMELGDLRIGLNRTDYAWDGRDEFGDQLANGVYLYRVMTRTNAGEEIENFATGTEEYFKNGFGKMVIVR